MAGGAGGVRIDLLWIVSRNAPLRPLLGAGGQVLVNRKYRTASPSDCILAKHLKAGPCCGAATCLSCAEPNAQCYSSCYSVIFP